MSERTFRTVETAAMGLVLAVLAACLLLLLATGAFPALGRHPVLLGFAWAVPAVIEAVLAGMAVVGMARLVRQHGEGKTAAKEAGRCHL